MGGSVNIGWRKADDTFEVMTVYTNAMLRAFHSPDFMRGDTTPLERHFANYRLGQQKKHGFGPGEPVPAAYGFILVDEVEKKIFDWQGYTTLATVLPFDIGYEKPDPLDVQLQRREALLPFVVGARHLTRGGVWVDIDFPGPFTEDMYEPFARSLQQGDRNPIIELKLDYPGWEIVTLPENSARALQTIKDAVSCCTELTEAQENVWAKAAKKMMAEDAEAAVAAKPPGGPVMG